MKEVRILLVVAIGFVNFHCKKENCLKNAGTVIVVKKDLPSFTEVNLSDNINLYLVQDTVNRVEIKAGEHQHPSVYAVAENDALTLKYEPGCQWLRDANERIDVYLHTKSLRRLNYEGYGNVSSLNTLTVDEFTFISGHGAGQIQLTVDTRKVNITSNGNADLVISGQSNDVYAYINLRSTIDLRNLVTKRLDMYYLSVFDGYVHVTDKLKATIYYKGNLYYTGQPVIDVQKLNTGELLAF